MVSKDDIIELARLSRLDVSDTEVQNLQLELGSILEYVEQLSLVDVGELQPMSHVHGIHSVMRADEVRNVQNTDKYLSAAPDSKDGLIKVPIVIE